MTFQKAGRKGGPGSSFLFEGKGDFAWGKRARASERDLLLRSLLGTPGLSVKHTVGCVVFPPGVWQEV